MRHGRPSFLCIFRKSTIHHFCLFMKGAKGIILTVTQSVFARSFTIGDAIGFPRQNGPNLTNSPSVFAFVMVLSYFLKYRFNSEFLLWTEWGNFLMIRLGRPSFIGPHAHPFVFLGKARGAIYHILLTRLKAIGEGMAGWGGVGMRGK